MGLDHDVCIVLGLDLGVCASPMGQSYGTVLWDSPMGLGRSYLTI